MDLINNRIYFILLFLLLNYSKIESKLNLANVHNQILNSKRESKAIHQNPNSQLEPDSKNLDESIQNMVSEGASVEKEKCQDGVFKSFSKNSPSSSFWLCNHGKNIQFNCPADLQWNQLILACDWPPPNKLKEVETCDETTRQYKPDNKDCSHFYRCDHNQYIQFSCSPGLYWNIDHCDWVCGTGTGTGAESVGVTLEEPSVSAAVETTVAPLTTTVESPTTTVSVSQSNPWEWEPEAAHEVNTAQPLTFGSSEYKMVCYFTNWAYYRSGIGKFKPSDVDFNLCTHIAYAFATLDYEQLTLKAYDSWLDLENKFYRQMVKLKTWGVKVVIALGGWNDSQGDKYSRLVNNPASRARFIAHAIEFLEKYQFDGLDFDWEYPVCWQNDCKKGPSSDKLAFATFVQEISAAFKPKGFLLSAAVSAGKQVIDEAYDVPTLSKYLDWISVMTYDYHGQWDNQTGHVAPLYFHEEDYSPYLNVNYSMNYWLAQGASPTKLIMGMPLYGQSFTLKQNLFQSNRGNFQGLNLNHSGPGTAGEFTRQSGFLAYYEICSNIHEKRWTVTRNEKDLMGPTAHDGANQWVSFDDIRMLKIKSEFIKKMGLGGGMIWALDLDDHKGHCGCGTNPLLKTINNALRNYPQTPSEDCFNYG